MSPGVTDLTAVALPVLPAGHRWVIDRSVYDSWTERKRLGIQLQELVVSKWRKPKWKTMAARNLERKSKGDWVGGFYDEETLVQCAERTAKEIHKEHVKRLEKLLEEESIIGVYESH